MKKIIRHIIFTILRWEAMLVLRRFKPRIIGVAGSVGKTSTKDAIYAALKDYVSIRKNEKSLNSEIGVPLTILGLESGWHSPQAWLSNIVRGCRAVFAKSYPEWLVLELGTDRPGDMRGLVSWLALDYAVFTRFPEVPVHAENFAKAQDVNEEDAQMMFGLKKSGVLVLNSDDAQIAELALKSTFKTVWYGFASKTAGVSASNLEVQYDADGRPTGQSVKVNFGSNSVPLVIEGALGLPHVYPVLAALIVAKDMGVNVLDALQSVQGHRVPPGRMNLLAGAEGMTLIDDTYNSSPVAVAEALKALASVKADTRIAILGDMAELGKYSLQEHKKVALLLKECKIKRVITFGAKAEAICEEAKEQGVKHAFNALSYADAARKVLEWRKGGTVVLIKGSQSARMEKVTLELLEDRSEARRRLVRQEAFWKK